MKIRKIIEKLENPENVQFFPTVLRTSNGETEKFDLVISLNTVECIDFDKSLIPKWFIPGVMFNEYKRIHIVDRCLGDLHIARVKFRASMIVISSILKRELGSICDLKHTFYRDIDLPTEDQASLWNLG
jgi:hypothetical protein